MRRPIAPTLVSLFSLFLFLPAGATAALPSTKHKDLKLGTSIGGVKLGMKSADALKAWGQSRSSCADVPDPTKLDLQDCNWDGKAKEARASIEFRDGKVFSISLDANDNSTGVCHYEGAVAKWKDAKGIGLGSDLVAIKKKYKKLVYDGGGAHLIAGKHATLFTSSGGRACGITVGFTSAFEL